MNLSGKRWIIAAGAAVAIGTGVLTATAAMASPNNQCANGIYSGYCGTQVSEDGVSLTGSGNSILGLHNPHTDTADFFWFRFQGGSNDIAEFAPGGVASNKVMAEQGGHLRLETANGLEDEQWYATFIRNVGGIDYYTWTNELTGDILKVNGAGHYASAIPDPGTYSNSEVFQFVTP